MKNIKAKIIPLSLTVCIILADQLSKLWIVKNIRQNTIGYSFWDGFLRIIHTRNTGIAFSIGSRWPESVRMVFFQVLTLLILIAFFIYYWRTIGITSPQRWAMTGILGGGLGNLLDRVFRKEGVVDFIDVNVHIIPNRRWPAFNVADSSVVVCAILLLIFIVIEERRKGRE